MQGHERARVRGPRQPLARGDPKGEDCGRLVLHPDGSIDPEASDARRAAAADPSKQRGARTPERSSTASAAAPKLKPVPTAAVAAVGDTLWEHGMPAPSGGGATFLQAKTANEVLKSQERRLKLQKLKGELVDRARAEALVFPSPARPATPG
jgi:hypothetical protein